MKFEILLSTMFRTDLGFLDNIFKNNNLLDYDILIINQTTPDKLLKVPTSKKIRIINSFERGTAISRNLAINNAKGKFCLIADDDIVYEKDFEKVILNEFNNYKDAYLLSFEASNYKKIPHQNYPKQQQHNKKSLRPIHNIVMCFKLELVKKHSVFYNKYFSLGGKFGNGEEYLFLRDAYKKGLKAYHIKKNIVFHDSFSSGKAMSSDSIIHTRAARKNHFYNTYFALGWLCKYLFFLYRHNFIKAADFKSKFMVGLKGINDYNELLKKGLIKRQK